MEVHFGKHLMLFDVMHKKLYVLKFPELVTIFTLHY